MDAFLSEFPPLGASDAVVDADADLHDLQHVALSCRRLRGDGRLLPVRMEEIRRRRRDGALPLTCLPFHLLQSCRISTYFITKSTHDLRWLPEDFVVSFKEAAKNFLIQKTVKERNMAGKMAKIRIKHFKRQPQDTKLAIFAIFRTLPSPTIPIIWINFSFSWIFKIKFFLQKSDRKLKKSFIIKLSHKFKIFFFSLNSLKTILVSSYEMNNLSL